MDNFRQATDKWVKLIIEFRKTGKYSLELDNLHKLSVRPPTDTILQFFAETASQIKIEPIRRALFDKFIVPILGYNPYKSEFKDKRTLIQNIFDRYKEAYNSVDEALHLFEVTKAVDPIPDNAVNIVEKPYGRYVIVTYTTSGVHSKGSVFGLALLKDGKKLPIINSTYKTKADRSNALRNNIFPLVKSSTENIKETLDEAMESDWNTMADILARLFLGDRNQAVNQLKSFHSLQLNVELSTADYNRAYKNLYNKFLTLLKAELGTLVESEDDKDTLPTLSEMIVQYMKDAPDLLKEYVFSGLKDNIMDNITYEELITTLETNEEKFDKKVIVNTFRDIMYQRINSAQYDLNKRIKDILKHLQSG